MEIVLKCTLSATAANVTSRITYCWRSQGDTIARAGWGARGGGEGRQRNDGIYGAGCAAEMQIAILNLAGGFRKVLVNQRTNVYRVIRAKRPREREIRRREGRWFVMEMFDTQRRM